MALNRTSGGQCQMRAGGSQESVYRFMRSQVGRLI
jgi:hypothetical protein